MPAFAYTVMHCDVFSWWCLFCLLSSLVNLAAVGKPEAEGGKNERAERVDSGVTRLLN